MSPIITTILNSTLGYFAAKHSSESGGAAVATQLSALPAIAGTGVITMTEYGSDVDAVVALISVVLSVVLYFYRARK